MHWWFSGRILACHAGGPGSIPGQCNAHRFFLWLNRFFLFFFPYYFSFFLLGNCVGLTKKKKKKRTKKSKQKNHQYNTIQRTNISRSQKLWHDDQIVLSFDRLFTNLLILRKWCRFEKPNHYYFV